MAKMKLYYTTPDKLDELPVNDGQIIFVPDSKQVCLDLHDIRYNYSLINVFETQEEMLANPFPNQGFYYAVDTNSIWRYSNRWSRITSGDTEAEIFYGTSEEDFPETGVSQRLYYTDNGIYNWKDQLEKYNLIANANRWETM